MPRFVVFLLLLLSFETVSAEREFTETLTQKRPVLDAPARRPCKRIILQVDHIRLYGVYLRNDKSIPFHEPDDDYQPREPIFVEDYLLIPHICIYVAD